MNLANNKKRILTIAGIACVILLVLYFVFIRGIYASSDKIVGPYRNAEIYEDFLDYDSWQIGENMHGDPIFCFEDNAFQFIKIKYADVLNNIYELYHDQYNLRRLNKKNYVAYRDLLFELSLSNINEEERNKYSSLIELFDIYKNGQKRFKYVIGNGWGRY